MIISVYSTALFIYMTWSIGVAAGRNPSYAVSLLVGYLLMVPVFARSIGLI